MRVECRQCRRKKTGTGECHRLVSAAALAMSIKSAMFRVIKFRLPPEIVFQLQVHARAWKPSNSSQNERRQKETGSLFRDPESRGRSFWFWLLFHFRFKIENRRPAYRPAQKSARRNRYTATTAPVGGGYYREGFQLLPTTTLSILDCRSFLRVISSCSFLLQLRFVSDGCILTVVSTVSTLL